MATERQIEANRRNAQLSTGPRTDEGKQRSRRNALLHGLAGAGTILPDPDAARVAERLESWSVVFELRTPEDHWNLQELVVNSVRVEACRAREAALLSYESTRAAVAWDEDRLHEAEEIGAALSRRPALTVRRLGAFAAGVRWMLARWDALAVLEEWTDEHKSLAFDLLGVAPILRHGEPWKAHGSPAALVEAERTRWKEQLETALEPLDAMEQELAQDRMPVRISAEVRRLRRYEAECTRRYRQAKQQLTPKFVVPEPAPSPSPQEVLPPPPATPAAPPPPPVSPTVALGSIVPDRAALSRPEGTSERRPNRKARRAALRRERAGRS